MGLFGGELKLRLRRQPADTLNMAKSSHNSDNIQMVGAIHDPDHDGDVDTKIKGGVDPDLDWDKDATA